MRGPLLTAAALLLAAGLLTAGCGKKEEGADAKGETAKGGTAKGVDSEAAKIEAAIAKLDPADQELAKKQAVCPVAVANGSEGKLGSMGVPVVVEVKGRKVFLCCPGCREELEADPDKFLATLDK